MLSMLFDIIDRRRIELGKNFVFEVHETTKVEITIIKGLVSCSINAQLELIRNVVRRQFST